MLKGKQGRFRQNLLGKSRLFWTVCIVVGPELKLHQWIAKKNGPRTIQPFLYAIR